MDNKKQSSTINFPRCSISFDTTGAAVGGGRTDIPLMKSNNTYLMGVNHHTQFQVKMIQFF